MKVLIAKNWLNNSWLTSLFMIGVVHEHPRIGSDGESEEGSGTSEDPNVSPTSDEIAINNGKQATEITHVKLRQKPVGLRKVSNQVEKILSVKTSKVFITTTYNLTKSGGDQQEAFPTCRPQVTRQLHHQADCQPHTGGSYHKVWTKFKMCTQYHVKLKQSDGHRSGCFFCDPTLYLMNRSQSKPDLADSCHPDLSWFLPVLLGNAQINLHNWSCPLRAFLLGILVENTSCNLSLV